ncbi:MAG: hypothetical protein LBT23_07825 [Synergistaceae bacterium]|jgi:hypothetical protein|nr:hypothetical protein [Synergistaceae bacterium]
MAAATLFVFTLLCAYPFAAESSVRIEGMNDWLKESAERGLEAVYDHIPQTEPMSVKEGLLRVVADRLLLGYSVDSVTIGPKDAVAIKLRLAATPPDWDVAISPPNLSPPVDGWFASDVDGMEAEIASLVKGVPMETLAWGDIDLRREIERMSAERIPGWRVALLARSASDGGTILDVSFTPEQPLALAVTTKINSSSIPAILHSRLRGDLIKSYAPVIGVPVPWLERHETDMQSLGRDVLSGEYLVEVAKADPKVNADAGVVSNVDVELESKRYSAWLWMAVYAGAEDRYPEVGLHLGRRVQPFSRLEMELYGELILRLDDWELEKRLGVRWSPLQSLWVGGEWSDMDDIWWARVAVESWARRPYVWLRYSEEDDVNAALGYRFNDYISIELHYDSRFDDEWNVRALLNL